MSTVETKYCYRHPDRPTGLSCSECGRPICEDCMTVAPVGLRCPEHAGGVKRGPAKRGGGRQLIAPTTHLRGTEALVTKTLIAVNVAIYLITCVQGAGLNAPGGPLWNKMILWGPYVARGDWWRLITAAFLHASILHIGFNMLALWWFGAAVEQYLGRGRFIGLYLVGGLAGSAGALIQAPLTPVVGASGAIFAILGSMLILEWQTTGRLAGNAMTLIVINLALGFAIVNVSIGGHIGGLIGGILATLAFARWGKGHAAYGKLGIAGVVGLVVVALASVAIAYWKVRGLA
ncbi:MAG TPA: rhomboid family intramembrane serine protease [Gaiellaceae bacterium]|nr:rhomboid family intramembrane serine protease [Gaiellaceae bacterium]